MDGWIIHELILDPGQKSIFFPLPQKKSHEKYIGNPSNAATNMSSADILSVIYVSCLFFLLIPNLFIRIPIKGGNNQYVIAFVHAAMFAAVFFFTYNVMYRFFSKMTEGFGPKGKKENFSFDLANIKVDGSALKKTN